MVVEADGKPRVLARRGFVSLAGLAWDPSGKELSFSRIADRAAILHSCCHFAREKTAPSIAGAPTTILDFSPADARW